MTFDKLIFIFKSWVIPYQSGMVVNGKDADLLIIVVCVKYDIVLENN